MGQTPNVSITDLALVKLITIKDFDNFINRPVSQLSMHTNVLYNNGSYHFWGSISPVGIFVEPPS